MGSSKTAAFHTLGCKLNFAETGTLARSLEEAGYARVKVEERPDVFVLNTCSVTENADKECRQWVRRFQRINPEAFIAVVGCYAQLKPEEIAAIPGVGLVLGANEKFDLAVYLPHPCPSLKERGSQPTPLAEASEPTAATAIDPAAIGVRTHSPLSFGEGPGVRYSPIKDLKHFVPSWNLPAGQAGSGDRTRTYLKVQDGCDYFCSFCTIPLARGRSRSGTIAETVAVAKGIAASGVKEIVLTGVNTGDFGRSGVTSSAVEKETFLELIEALDRVQGIARFRISSIEPNLCSDEVIDFVAKSSKFMPHFHMPLQSGSDTILERMRRRYDTALYADRVAHIKRVLPHACIGADVITGTPGETDEEFMKTHEFLRTLRRAQGDSGVDYLHAFTYSERANTTATRMADTVPMEVRRERTKQLRILSSKFQRAQYERNIGTTRRVLFEAEETDRCMHGYTDNYIRVSAPFDTERVNTVHSVLLGRVNGDGHVTACDPVEAAALQPIN